MKTFSKDPKFQNRWPNAIATFFITYISYAEKVIVEGNLGDNDHEMEEPRKWTLKTYASASSYKW